ncbi:MAG TPA: hypothetical protein VMN78_11630 [Longimicrobiales bacterium]|nr:hypothetical protein [Longimicrobiales bacterium]
MLDPKELGLPTDAGAVQRYLTNRYRGVGDRTAEQLVETFGAEHVFAALQAASDRVSEVVGAHRAAALLDAWRLDYARRTGADTDASDGSDGAGPSDVERELPAPVPEREAVPAEREVIPAEVERESGTPAVDRELPPAADIERATPDLWSNPREPRRE